VAGALAIHPGALGDVLLAVPALRALRAGVPGPLALAAQPRIAALLAALGVVDDGVRFETLKLDALFTDDGRPDPRVAAAARVVCWFGARDPGFVRRLRAVAPGAVIAPSATGEGPVWEHLLRSVGAPDGEWRAPVAVPEPLRGAGREALVAAGWDGAAPPLAVHPGAGGVDKRWPVEALAAAVDALVARHALAAVVHEGPADAEAARALRARLRVPSLALHGPALPVLAGALDHAALFVGSDSGVSHLAAAVGAPAVGLFRAANLAWRSWSPSARALVDASPAAVLAAAGAVVGEGRRDRGEVR
jgi:hypothetical protein